jgi:mannose-1-phosphate guanylyltransferase
MGTYAELWAIVLAGGEGTRLTPLTTALYGRPVPKQFAVVAGTQSLLAQTLERLARLVPLERTIVIATHGHEELAARELASFPGTRLVLQPCNRDTAAGILVGLSHVIARAPDARVLVVPSDHYVRDTNRFVRAMSETTEQRYDSTILLTLLGVRPEAAEIEYGWIVPGRQVPSDVRPDAQHVYTVECFVEKPPLDVARVLQQSGALWNTLVVAGLARNWWSVCEEHLPNETAAFRGYVDELRSAAQSRVLAQVYAEIPSINFSRRVLERIPERLGVVACEDVGWSDLGTPRRVFDALEGSADAQLLIQRLNRRARQAGESRPQWGEKDDP